MPRAAVPVQHLPLEDPFFLAGGGSALGKAEPLHVELRWGRFVVGITSQIQGNHLGGALAASCAAAGVVTPSRGSGITWKIKAGWLWPGAHSFMQTWNLAPPGSLSFLKVLGSGAVERGPSC